MWFLFGGKFWCIDDYECAIFDSYVLGIYVSQGFFEF